MPPAFEVLLLNTAVPQIQAAQSGDTYVVPRDIAFSAALTLSAGTANGVPYLNASKVLTTGSALTFDGTNLGIGVAGSSPLSFANATGQKIRFYNALSGYGIGVESSEFRFVTDNSAVFTWGIGTYASPSEQMRLTSTGLGIGTSSPQAKLDVANGNVFITQDYEVQWKAGAVTRAAIRGTSGDNLSFYTRVGGVVTETMRLDSSGNLGIGTTSPTGKFTAQGSVGSFYIDAGATGVAFTYNGGNYISALGGSNATLIFETGGAVERMRLDSSGNLGLGTTSPGDKLTVAAGRIRLDQDYQIVWQNAGTNRARILGDASSNIIFETGSSNTERARITSGGDLLVGTQTNDPAGTVAQIVNRWSGGVKWGASFDQTVSSATAYTHINFSTNGTTVGNINANNTSTTYATSSDYRLKDNQQPLTGSGAFIDALQPKTWDWKSGGKGVGFIAHEVQAVSPGTVVGEKDAVDADGKPIMQAMEYGSAEFIANIIAELQSLRARVAQLEGN